MKKRHTKLNFEKFTLKTKNSICQEAEAENEYSSQSTVKE